MRRKWKQYKLEPALKKMPAAWKDQRIYYYFIGTTNREARLILTHAGYKAIMQKDGKHFSDLWEYVERS